MNIENYPQDANGYDSLGDYYEATGDSKKAIENYTKALSLGNDADTKRKLENLKTKKWYSYSFPLIVIITSLLSFRLLSIFVHLNFASLINYGYYLTGRIL